MQPKKSEIKPYFDTLQAEMKEHRDSRGKVHDLAFVLCGVVTAILHGRKTPSSIQRFMSNRHEELIQKCLFYLVSLQPKNGSPKKVRGFL